VAAMLEKRNFIGIELDENYCAIARKRLEDTQKENGLG
jgi:DNA modification methylase